MKNRNALIVLGVMVSIIISACGGSTTTAKDYYDRGKAYGELDDYERAIADYTKALEFDFDSPVVYLDRGYAYGTLGDYEQALADFDRYLELDPNALSRKAVSVAIENLKSELGQ